MSTPVDTGQILLLGASRLNRLQIEVLAQLKEPLTVRQYRILLRIDEGVTSLSDLSKLAHRSLPTTSESVDGLIRRKLLTRGPSEIDRRAVVLQLTRSGRRALADAHEKFEGLAAAILSAVPEQEQKAFAKFSALIYTYAGKELWGEEA